MGQLNSQLPLEPSQENVQRAAACLRGGGVVILPTETVYGLAANALDPAAVNHVFAIKGRPSDHPLIVHIAEASQIEGLALAVPSSAWVLAEKFWPGPLTLILQKAAQVPSETTGGLSTVAVRVPAHPVALAVLHEAGIPLAAPSANRFTRLSPTSAEDLDPEVTRQVDLVLDGGPCDVGIESTVLDLTSGTPVILRPGHISPSQLSAVLGVEVAIGSGNEKQSPGTHRQHYQPHTPLVIVEALAPDMPGIVLGEPSAVQISLGTEPHQFQRGLYSALNDLDHRGVSTIYIQAPPRSPEWAAVWDRIARASS